MDSPNISPFIYQDLMDSNYGIMPNLGNPFMTGMYPTNMLGGTRLPAQPDGDKFMRMQERNAKDKNVFLKSMAALAIIGGSAALLFRGKINFSKFWKTTKNAAVSPFKWAGKAAKNGYHAAGNGIVSAGKGTKKGLSKIGHAIATPFKWLGRNIKNGYKRIKGFKDPSKQSTANTPAKMSANKTNEVLYPDKIIIPEKKPKQPKKKKVTQIINIS